MAVGNEIMHTNVNILFLKEFYDDTFWRKKIWNPQMKNRRNFDGRIVKIMEIFTFPYMKTLYKGDY